VTYEELAMKRAEDWRCLLARPLPSASTPPPLVRRGLQGLEDATLPADALPCSQRQAAWLSALNGMVRPGFEAAVTEGELRSAGTADAFRPVSLRVRYAGRVYLTRADPEGSGTPETARPVYTVNVAYVNPVGKFSPWIYVVAK
jgi:hypothetical protein